MYLFSLISQTAAASFFFVSVGHSNRTHPLWFAMPLSAITEHTRYQLKHDKHLMRFSWRKKLLKVKKKKIKRTILVLLQLLIGNSEEQPQNPIHMGR